MKMSSIIFAICSEMSCESCPIHDCECRYTPNTEDCAHYWHAALSKMEIEDEETVVNEVLEKESRSYSDRRRLMEEI